MALIVKSICVFLVIVFVLAPAVNYFYPGGSIWALALSAAAFFYLYERVERAIRRKKY